MTLFADAAGDIFELFYDGGESDAVSAVHASADSAEERAETGCTVVFDYSEAAEARGADALGATAVIRVRVSEVAAVAAGEHFTTAAGAVWEVLDARLSSDGREWVCECSKR